MLNNVNFINEIYHENPKDFRFSSRNPYGASFNCISPSGFHL
jgi:hypothetical protein